jgi:hypothetical protein
MRLPRLGLGDELLYFGDACHGGLCGLTDTGLELLGLGAGKHQLALYRRNAGVHVVAASLVVAGVRT